MDKTILNVNEHNTNQNEANYTQNKSINEERFISKSVLDSVLDLKNYDAIRSTNGKFEPDSGFSVPSIIITPPIVTNNIGPKEGKSLDNVELDLNQSFPMVNQKNLQTNISCPDIGNISVNKISGKTQLCLPKHDFKEDKQANFEQNLQPKSQNETGSDFDITYNLSSTPKKFLQKREEDLAPGEEQSMMHIDPPSPIEREEVSSFHSDNTSTPKSLSQHSSASNRAYDTSGTKCDHIDTPRPKFEINNHSSSQISKYSDRGQLYSDQSGRSPNRFFHQSQGPMAGGNNNYYYPQAPSLENSFTDMSYRPDLSQPPINSGNCYQSSNLYENEHFVYPSIYVSSAGLISVLLRNDMSVEMTVDRTIRVVSHNHMMAIATDSRGTAACLYHPAAKVFQVGPTTDIATDTFRARMGSGECILFSNGVQYFKLEDSDLQPTAAIKFSDITRDQSVNMLFSSEGYGESLVASSMQVASQAEYSNLPKGGVIVHINGVKVTQTGGGDVSVVTGAKFIRLSSYYGTARLGNRFVDIEIEKDWTVKLTKGTHSFIAARKCAMVCNGKMEAGFDENNSLKVANLVPRHPLLTDNRLLRRPPPRKPVRFIGPPGPGPMLKRKPEMGRGGRMF